MQALINRKQARNANCYKIIYGRNDFRQNSVLKGANRKRLTDNKDDSVYSINFHGKTYAIKQMNKYDEDEWDCIVKMITEGMVCPYMIEYYACIKSLSNHKKYVLMKLADMDLKDYLYKHSSEIDEKFLEKIIQFLLKFQIWCIDNLKMVYTDTKCRNILVQINKETGGLTLKMTDIGLMEDVSETYKLDKKMLSKDEIVNFMYPRRECSYQQCALFTIAMMIIEICTIDIKTYGDTSSEEEDEESRTDSDTYSESEETDSEDEPESFISFLDGRETDEKIVKLIENLPFFKDNKHEKLKKYLIELVEFKYDNVKEALETFEKKDNEEIEKK